MYYVRYPLSFRQVEDILHERGIDICHETVRFWVNRFGAKFAKEIRKNRVGHHSNWQWHLDEVFVKINGERFYLWRAVDHEGEVLECFITKGSIRIIYAHCLTGRIPAAAVSTARGVGCLGRTAR